MKCNKCNGIGTIERDGKLYECVCSFLKRVSGSMPMFIRTAEVKPGHLKLPILDQITKSIYVIASWSDMKAIVKILYLKYPTKFFRITSDAEIRDVYVGSKSKSSKSSDYDGEILNNLSDLMDLPDLMILRLNEIFNKNKAAPGAVEEAIIHRADRDKPTWIFSDINRPFSVGSFAYSESLAELIDSSFPKMTIEKILASNQSMFSPPAEFRSNEQIEKEPIKEKVRKPRVVQPSDDIDNSDVTLSGYGQGLGFKKKGFNRE